MMSPRVPGDEAQRLLCLRSLQILDTPPDAAFDAAVQAAATLCGCPIALVSLVDADRQWFKARVGLQAAQTPRETSICAHALERDDMLVVHDARADARFAGYPSVTGAPHVRFYAGEPLRIDGQVMGTLCVIDTQPRDDASPATLPALPVLGRVVEALLRQHRSHQAVALAHARLADLVRTGNDILWETDAAGQVTWSSDVPSRTGHRHALQPGQPLWRGPLADRPGRIAPAARTLHDLLQAGRRFAQVQVHLPEMSEHETLAVSAVPVHDDLGRCIGWRGSARDITEERRQASALAAAEARMRMAVHDLEQLRQGAAAGTARLATAAMRSRAGHDLRTPLNAILGFAQLLAADNGHPLAAAQKRWVELLMQAARHQLALVDELFDETASTRIAADGNLDAAADAGTAPGA